MTTFIALLPERGLAVFASNNLKSAAPRAIVNHILAAAIADADSGPAADWIEIIAQQMSQLLADAYVTFTLDPQGGVERIRMQAVSPATDFSYDFHDLDLRPVKGHGACQGTCPLRSSAAIPSISTR